MNHQKTILKTLLQMRSFMNSSKYDTQYDELYEQVEAAIKVATDPDQILVKAEFVCEFTSFTQWVNKAPSWLNGIDTKSLLCVDVNGEQCSTGREFDLAKVNNLFPVKAYQLIKNTDRR